MSRRFEHLKNRLIGVIILCSGRLAFAETQNPLTAPSSSYLHREVIGGRGFFS